MQWEDEGVHTLSCAPFTHPFIGGFSMPAYSSESPGKVDGRGWVGKMKLHAGFGSPGP